MKYYIDFEATQFSERIISIGCVASNGKTFKTLVKPTLKKDKVNTFISQLTGITNEMLKDAPTADEAFCSFFDFVIENSGNKIPEYFCYGSSDIIFIERTLPFMTNIKAITFLQALKANIQDYSVKVKEFFKINNEISLRKIYQFIQQEKIENQQHDALEDAQMLFDIATNLKSKCSLKDVSKINSIKIKKIAPKEGRLERAPEIFIQWPSDKWEADTQADENNWLISCTLGNRTKYFNSKEIAMLWVIRYITEGLSVKKISDQNIVYDGIEEGLLKEKRKWHLIWSKNENR